MVYTRKTGVLRRIISGALIQEEALYLNKLMDDDSAITVSNGWFDKWKNKAWSQANNDKRREVIDQ